MAKKRTDLKIPYGIMDFRRLRMEGYYYVDKTEYLAQMEARDSFIFFVRPRRFGKSLFISMMENYYDLNRKKDRPSRPRLDQSFPFCSVRSCMNAEMRSTASLILASEVA
ncbi:MAG: AAA family ATPase [Kiritimatiellae bacterium]|nr:AAA family ATPase [Kiritimatiellia bacterium]